MSILNSVSAFGRKASRLLDQGLGVVRTTVNTVQKGISDTRAFIDELFEMASDIPILAPLAEQIKESDVYRTGSEFVDDLEEVLMNADHYLEQYANRDNRPRSREPDLGYDLDYNPELIRGRISA